MSWKIPMGLALMACLLGPLPANAADRARPGDVPGDGRPVALELIMAIDASASVTTGGLEFQLRGHAAALRDPAVQSTASAGGMAAAVVAFSGPRVFHVLVPWTVMRDDAQVDAFADRVAAASRNVPADSTALGAIIDAATRMFADNGITSGRQVLDIVSNGFCNAGVSPSSARDRAVAAGITINALAILDEFPWLEDYYREEVVGGFGGFVIAAMDRDSFTDALRRKLVQEVAGVPTATFAVAAR